MDAYEWDKNLNLGIPEVDEQHKFWFALTNRFLRLIKINRTELSALQETLLAAIGYAREHFKAEEAFMRRLDFPKSEYDWHCMTHDAFFQRVSALAKHCRSGHPKRVEELAAFMCGWLTSHIMTADVKYLGFYLSKNGLRPRMPSCDRLAKVGWKASVRIRPIRGWNAPPH